MPKRFIYLFSKVESRKIDYYKKLKNFAAYLLNLLLLSIVIYLPIFSDIHSNDLLLKIENFYTFSLKNCAKKSIFILHKTFIYLFFKETT